MCTDFEQNRLTFISKSAPVSQAEALNRLMSVLKNRNVAHGVVITSPAVIILLSAIIEPLVAFAWVSSAFPNNSLALSLSKAKYKMREKRFCQNDEREN